MPNRMGRLGIRFVLRSRVPLLRPLVGLIKDLCKGEPFGVLVYSPVGLGPVVSVAGTVAIA
jgi:hypothetical protein